MLNVVSCFEFSVCRPTDVLNCCLFEHTANCVTFLSVV